METLEIINEMRQAVKNGIASVLTLDLARELKGKKIRTIYFGYRGQDGTDEFVVGEIVPESTLIANKAVAHKYANTFHLLADDGRHTYIRSHPENCGEFTCSDTDRNVYFIEL